ncbi:MAG: hypothetical protein AVDCRST_MAG36-1054 [uncultured Nocardioidaceae bacterium]|uniref:Phage shock protein PspC N-terminal domain-containing protein n=1 Tax=uncultured Nocardioidaceae bacterium TaxID=253824 RepID=A0A6J4LJL5_9ACTN|nr:MAG: hypothetical protein AVDCRST_MAG36-1054 [uncultured Nocardioidaceae bacterium]
MTDTAPPPPPPGPTADPYAGPFAGSLAGRPLRRSRTDRTIAGVAGGLGRWLDIDPTVLRVLFVVLAFFGGAGLLLYGVAWLVVPEEGAEQGAVPTAAGTRTAVLVGALAVAVFVVLGIGSLDGRPPRPLVVVGVAVAAVLLARDDRRSRAGVPPGAPPPPPPPTPPGPAPAAGRGGTEPTVVLEKPAWYPPPAPPPPAPSTPPRSGPLLFAPALALLSLGLGLLGVYDVSGGDVVAAAYPALALALVGLLLVVGAFVGRPGGLVALGIVAAGSLLVTAVVDPAYSGPRELVLRPTSADALDDSYRVPTGRIELDLRGLDPATLDGRALDVSVRAGDVLVLLPRSVRVTYDAAVDFGGQVDDGRRSSGGWSPRLSGTLGPEDAEADLELRLAADFGQLRLERW